ncbi:retrovirus-related pol polyprotein from transposon TNT 1-94 [Tanacetum coccineum]
MSGYLKAGSCILKRASVSVGVGCVWGQGDMRLNIISTGLLDEDGYHNSSESMNSASKDSTRGHTLNDLAERMDRTLVERVRCLLSHAGLMILVGSGKDVSYYHLRVFRCKASVHIPKDERSKLDVKGKPCVFLGYGQDEFGYRLYDPVRKKLVHSRDVVFEEDLTLKDVEKAERETIPQHNDDLIDLDPVPPKHFDSKFRDDISEWMEET